MAKTQMIDGHIVRIVGRVCDVAIDHVIPHERNGHFPYLLRKTALSIIAGFLVVSKALLIIAPLILPGHSAFSSAVTIQNIMALTTAEREVFGLPPLKPVPQLALAAQKKAKDMAEKGYFAHRSPTGESMKDFIQSTGYRYDAAGENLAMKFTEAETLTDAWMTSPSHRKNILASVYTETGIGIAQGQKEHQNVLYVVQYFGHPDLRNLSDVIAVIAPESIDQKIPLAIETQSTAEVFAPSASAHSESSVLGEAIGISRLNDVVQYAYIATIALLTGLLFILIFIKAQVLRIRHVTQVYSVIFLGIIVLFA